MGPIQLKGRISGKLQLALLAVGPDDPVQELLGAAVNPALLVDGAQHQGGVVLGKLRIRAHAVDFGGGGKDDAGAVLDALADDAQVFLEVQFEDPQGLLDVGHGGGDGHQGQDQVALPDVVFDPLLVDGDVAFQEMEPGMVQGLLQLVGVEVHAIDLPVPGGEDAPGQGVADEAVDAEDQDFHVFPMR